MPASDPSFLLIRRDNIGDLVCTTPLIRALRERYPNSRICALVNSYTRAVLDNNPDLDAVFSYTKAKHRDAGQTVLGVHMARLRLLLKLRRESFDYVILAAPGFQQRALPLARFLKPKHIVGYVDPETPHPLIDRSVPYEHDPNLHEVEDTFRLLRTLGIEEAPPTVRVYPRRPNQPKPAGSPDKGKGRTIGIHISARKPSQRWPAERFVQLMESILETEQARFLLFWSPGPENHPLHPGDDNKAGRILQSTQGLPVTPHPTTQLSELIKGLDLCDLVICSDGGAMHLAAGLGKPILCFFGKSDPRRWHPWGVPYEVLQPLSQDVSDVSVAQAKEAFHHLTARLGAASNTFQ